MSISYHRWHDSGSVAQTNARTNQYANKRWAALAHSAKGKSNSFPSGS
jgi:hypothetical protein